MAYRGSGREGLGGGYRIVVVFLLVVVVQGRPRGGQEWYEPGWSDTFHPSHGDPNHGDRYIGILNAFKTMTNNSRDVDMGYDFDDHAAMQKQQLKKKPMYWLMALLYGSVALERTQLAIRCDNLYLSGFTNATGEWFSFKTVEYVIPGSTRLSFKSNYASLLGDDDDAEYDGRGTKGQAWKKLIGLELGLASIIDAANTMAACDGESRRALKLSVAKIIVAFIEGQRFPYIRELVRRAWSHPLGGKLDKRGARLIMNWKELSCGLLIWESYGKKKSLHAIK